MVEIRLFHCIVILRGQYRVQCGGNPTAADNSKIASHQFFNTIPSLLCCIYVCCPRCGGLACVIFVTGATIFQLCHIFDMPHPHYIIAVHISQVVKNHNGETCFDNKNQAVLQTSSQDEVFSFVAIASD